MPATSGITARQKEFCRLYTNPASRTFGNAQESYKLAGFKNVNPAQSAHFLLKRPYIKTYIDELEEKVTSSYNWTKKDYIQEGIDTIKELPRSSQVRAKYFDIIGKVFGFFSDAPVNNVLVYSDENTSDSQQSISSRIKSLINLQKSKNSETQSS
jgi:hypothetical protein